MTEGRKILRYKPGSQLVRGVGLPAHLKLTDDGGRYEGMPARVALTAPVTAYDKDSGTIETELTLYLPFRKDLEA